jgi:hypothetical protein
MIKIFILILKAAYTSKMLHRQRFKMMNEKQNKNFGQPGG